MPAFYALLSLISIVVFAWLGQRMARTRHRSTMGWALAGALLPPLLLILWGLKAAPADDGDETP